MKFKATANIKVGQLCKVSIEDGTISPATIKAVWISRKGEVYNGPAEVHPALDRFTLTELIAPGLMSVKYRHFLLEHREESVYALYRECDEREYKNDEYLERKCF